MTGYGSSGTVAASSEFPHFSCFLIFNTDKNTFLRLFHITPDVLKLQMQAAGNIFYGVLEC